MLANLASVEFGEISPRLTKFANVRPITSVDAICIIVGLTGEISSNLPFSSLPVFLDLKETKVVASSWLDQVSMVYM